MRYEIFIKNIRTIDCVHTMQSVTFFKIFKLRILEKNTMPIGMQLLVKPVTVTGIPCSGSGNCPQQRSSAIWHYEVPCGTPVQSV